MTNPWRQQQHWCLGAFRQNWISLQKLDLRKHTLGQKSKASSKGYTSPLAQGCMRGCVSHLQVEMWRMLSNAGEDGDVCMWYSHTEDTDTKRDTDTDRECVCPCFRERERERRTLFCDRGGRRTTVNEEQGAEDRNKKDPEHQAHASSHLECMKTATRWFPPPKCPSTTAIVPCALHITSAITNTTTKTTAATNPPASLPHIHSILSLVLSSSSTCSSSSFSSSSYSSFRRSLRLLSHRRRRRKRSKSPPPTTPPAALQSHRWLLVVLLLSSGPLLMLLLLLLLFFLMSLGVCKRQQMIHVFLVPNERNRLDIKSNRCSEQTAMQCSSLSPSLSVSALSLSLTTHTPTADTHRERRGRTTTKKPKKKQHDRCNASSTG